MDNSAQYDGGAVHLRDATNTIITITNSEFTDNSAQNDGGAVYLEDTTNVTVTITNSEFTDNSAQNDGGAIYLRDTTNTTITITDIEFMDDSAQGGGGAVYLRETADITVTITDSEFMGNTQYDHRRFFNGGGAMYMRYTINTTITITDCNFISNSAQGSGGALMWRRGSDTTININASNFSNNTAADQGGVVHAYDTDSMTIIMSYSNFTNNNANKGGVASCSESNDHVIISEGMFEDNSAHQDGGVFELQDTKVEITRSSFMGNGADNNGGIIQMLGGALNIIDSQFQFNTAGNAGGVVYLDQSAVSIFGSVFTSNRVGSRGGVLYVDQGILTIIQTLFTNNVANFGGVTWVQDVTFSSIIVDNSSFSNNEVDNDGGVMFVHSSSISIVNSFFTNNKAGSDGGVLYLCEGNSDSVLHSFSFRQYKRSTITVTLERNTFIENQAHNGGVIYASEIKVGVCCQFVLMANNTAIVTGGAIYVFKANLSIFSGNSTIMGNKARSGKVASVSESRLDSSESQSLLIANNVAMENGGGVYLYKGQLVLFSGNSMFIGNQAECGGALYASESKIFMELHSLIVKANVAINSGGGLYLIMSELNIGGNSTYISGNRANIAGGGLHVANSSIIIKEDVHLTNNEAEKGGGISLERYAQLKGASDEIDALPAINFVSNRASRHGGALFVDDETNLAMCAAVATQNASSTTKCFSSLVFINFFENFADISGSNLFGGLLDRCTVCTEFSQETEMHKPGVVNFQKFSNISDAQLDTISSLPVQVCFCSNSQPDCNYQPESIQVDRGKTFATELIAYDQVQNAINASVHCSLKSTTGGLGKDQMIQHVTEVCTKLQFNLFSPLDSEDLILSIKGPCNVTGISEKIVRLNIICTCPIGFQISDNDESTCDCVCDEVLQPYDKTECNIQTKSIIRKNNFWITYINHTNSSGYIIYPNCPFDYCHLPEEQVSINLNLPNGSDAQCASNHVGTLCGTCKSGYSVSLGSSHCLQCPTYWPGLLAMIVTVFILSGIGLVALLLVLNLTVAIGTLNVIIFYANILAANKNASSEVSFASVFISWLNFDFGIDTCFFDGMNMYVKTWLQLAFPAFIIFLVAVIIKLSYHFSVFLSLIHI